MGIRQDLDDLDRICREKCEYCEGASPLVIGEYPYLNDRGIAIRHPNYLNAYGFDVHGGGSNGIEVKINYCPMCGRMLDNA